jgi:hypothetical protein
LVRQRWSAIARLCVCADSRTERREHRLADTRGHVPLYFSRGIRAPSRGGRREGGGGTRAVSGDRGHGLPRSCADSGASGRRTHGNRAVRRRGTRRRRAALAATGFSHGRSGSRPGGHGLRAAPCRHCASGRSARGLLPHQCRGDPGAGARRPRPGRSALRFRQQCQGGAGRRDARPGLQSTQRPCRAAAAAGSRSMAAATTRAPRPRRRPACASCVPMAPWSWLSFARRWCTATTLPGTCSCCGAGWS